MDKDWISEGGKEMSKYDKGDSQIDGQMSLEHLYEPEAKLFGVHRIFARARKEMSLSEQKVFVAALSQLKFTEEADSNYVRLDKKTLANIVGIHSDSDHLSVDLFDNIKNLTAHSRIEIRERDLDFYASGFIITSVVSFKNFIRIRFNDDFLPMFTNLSRDYITMWNFDIFKMSSIRTVQFYEYLRQITDSRQQVNDVLMGVRAFKELFGIPENAYMREKGGFDRANFEKYVIDPLCEDMKHCRMINLLVQPDGKYYVKERQGNRVDGYRFYWTFSAHPGVATANEVKQLQERVDKDPEVLKIAKDILKGERKKKGKQNQFNQFNQNSYDWDALESELLGE